MGLKVKQFKSSINTQEKYLICPQCLEMLVQIDIENYSCCPFCEYHFELSYELEDFLLKPVVDHWIRKETQNRDFNHSMPINIF